MKYIYICQNCTLPVTLIRNVKDRAKDIPQCECGANKWKRKFSSPDNSKLIGALKASEKDGVGVLIDSGHINRPISRGSSDARKKEWQRDR